MQSMWLEVLLVMLYIGVLLVLGLLARRKSRNSNEFLNASGEMPLWICSVACIAANCGSLDVVMTMAFAAQYGIVAAHFYWIGAVPALLLLAFWLLPLYARGRYRSILDLIADHYGKETGTLIAVSMAVMMLMISSVGLCAAAGVLSYLLGWSFWFCVLLITVMVLVLTNLGGFRATIYSDVLHFVMALMALLPLVPMLVHRFGGVQQMLARIPPDRMHAWKLLPMMNPQAPVDRVGLFWGLGVVLAVSYWSTDFVVMQRDSGCAPGSGSTDCGGLADGRQTRFCRHDCVARTAGTAHECRGAGRSLEQHTACGRDGAVPKGLWCNWSGGCSGSLGHHLCQ